MTKPSPSLRVPTVLSACDVLALDAAAAREDLNRSQFIRRLIRARLREIAIQEAATCP